jgi:glycosyltransferase involved in cell wall biosynthesis
MSLLETLMSLLKSAQTSFQIAQGAKSLIVNRIPLAHKTLQDRKLRQRPRICLLVNDPDWSYDFSAQQIKKHLLPNFNIDIRYAVEQPQLSPETYDLLHVCFWADDHHQQFAFDRKRVIKEVSSHRWQYPGPYGPCTPAEFAGRYLCDCDTVICTSLRLVKIIMDVFPRTYHTPNGIDPNQFSPTQRHLLGDRLVFGWAGNPDERQKGFRDIIEPACGDRFVLLSTTGKVNYRDMPEFYRQIDVIIVSSRHEGEPLTLLEAMASGCFPVCVDVGIVPELIRHGWNGYIVPERTADAFRKAFEWCEIHRDKVHAAGLANAKLVARERNWEMCARNFGRVYKETIARANKADRLKGIDTTANDRPPLSDPSGKLV